MLRLHRSKGKSQIVLAHAHGSHGRLHGDRVDLAEEGIDEGHVVALHRGGL